MRHGTLIAAVLTAAAPLDAQRPAVVPSDSAVRAIIKERVDAKLAKGIVVGVLDPDGRRRVFTYGVSGTARPLDASSVFEIASITKTFTGVLLAEMAAQGEVGLEDPVARYLPTSVKVPSRNGREITLLDLATHSSGLPGTPHNFAPKDPRDPFASYTPELLFEFLSTHELQRDAGAEFEYSNHGYMLLGLALARRAGAASFEELLQRRVLDPLGLRDTRVTPTASMDGRLAIGHDQAGDPVPGWHMHPMLGGMGALRSTASDLLSYVAVNLTADLDSGRGPLATALRASHIRRGGGPPGHDIGLGWNRRAVPSGDSIVLKNGIAGGYWAFVGYNPARRIGVLVLSNSKISIDDIGVHLLAAEVPLSPPKLPSWVGTRPVSLPTAVLDGYVGEYAISPALRLTVTREGDALSIEPIRQAKMELFAEREDEFFVKFFDARISFRRDSARRVTALVLRERGREQVARRIPARTAKPGPAAPDVRPSTGVSSSAGASAIGVSDSTVRAIIKQRVDAKLATGLVIGLLDPDGRRRVFAYGSSGTPRPLDGNSVFEIASITKTFTAAVLADMAARDEVRLDDPLDTYLPATVNVPSRNGRRIALVDLATHSSALPRELGTHWPNDLSDPFADITPDLLFAFLSSQELRRDPGAEFEYSNVGFMLLSDALTRRAGAASYEELIRPRVLEPLGLGDTHVTLTPSMRGRLVLGHDQSGAVVPNWHMHRTLRGSGALLSTTNDLLTWVAANMAADLDSTRSSLSLGLRATHVRRRAGPPGQDIGLAWNRRALPVGDTIVSKNGSSGGYRAIVAYRPALARAVVVLTNSAIAADDIAFHLLAPELPLSPPKLPSWIGRKTVTLASDLLDSYVGEYALTPNFHVIVRRVGDDLVLKPTGDQTGQPMRLVTAERLFARWDDEFFVKVVDARISFTRDRSGRATALVIRQGGHEQVATRIQ